MLRTTTPDLLELPDLLLNTLLTALLLVKDLLGHSNVLPKYHFFQVIPLVSSNLKICEFSVLSQELCLKIERNDLRFCILSVSLPLLSDSMGIWTECELTWDEMLFSAQALGINRLKDSYKWIESIVSVFWMSLKAETFSCCSKGPEFHP